MAETDVYDVGETVILQATFRNEAGTLTTPTTYTLYIERPDGTVDTVAQGSITEVSAGVLQYKDTVDARGITHWRYVGVTGSNTVIEQDFYVGRQQQAIPSA